MAELEVKVTNNRTRVPPPAAGHKFCLLDDTIQATRFSFRFRTIHCSKRGYKLTWSKIMLVCANLT